MEKKIVDRILRFINHEIKEYGANKIIRDYSRFPNFLTLPCHCEHGWTALDVPLKTDLMANKLITLVFSQRRKIAWRKNKKIIVIFGAPLVRYRKIHNIKIKKNACGTIAFPSHSTEHVESIYNEKLFCEILRNLPLKYHPVTVCLHWHDIVRGKGSIFENEGFDVVTAGDMYSPEFPEKFYDILSSYKFSTSNVIGSYAFYSVDVGIPFFLSGPLSTMVNNGCDINVPDEYSLLDFPDSKRALEIFCDYPVETITSKQKEYVASEIGSSGCISRRSLFFILILMWPIDRMYTFFIMLYKLTIKILCSKNL